MEKGGQMIWIMTRISTLRGSNFPADHDLSDVRYIARQQRGIDGLIPSGLWSCPEKVRMRVGEDREYKFMEKWEKKKGTMMLTGGTSAAGTTRWMPTE